MKTITAKIIDEDMIQYIEYQRERYGSYASFMRSLIIDRMEGRQKNSYTEVRPVRKTREKIDKNPHVFMAELKEKLGKSQPAM